MPNIVQMMAHLTMSKCHYCQRLLHKAIVDIILSLRNFPHEVREELLSLISTVFPENPRTPQQILDIITECAKKTDLLTVFRYGEDRTEDVDHAILTAVLKRQNLSLPEQLSLTLLWNRVDVARSCLFSGGRHWPTCELHSAMKDALRLNRVDFVECLLENGVSMKKFLTIATLEQLYNLDDDAQHNVHFLVEHSSPTSYMTLPDIGLIIEKLMGNAYKHYYTSRLFKNNYEKFRKKAQLSRLSSFHIRLVAKTSPRRRKSADWANTLQCDEGRSTVLVALRKRPEMARCMWLHGEDAMAKSLVAARLYKAIARIAEEDYLEVEVAQQLREYCESSCSESLQLLDFCYREDNSQTLKLLTAQLPHWGYQNCLSLAVMVNHKRFLAHPCCQRLLAELWHGSLRSTTYDTVGKCRSDHLEENSVNNILSLPLQKFIKSTSRKKTIKTKLMCDEELDELVDNCDGFSKKVNIVSPKRSSLLKDCADSPYLQAGLLNYLPHFP
ncbi:unnamed protein product [Angiostrongylus costaricensis]|uniref:Non-specific serine/threonine protein kinase n=1 Tax=Angiostrongylus costaricensis TaxID=334426 RepID=A0A0R3PNK0_ANGCS|nr:unnamed protein product [Angiostrongylus costaricensis]